MASDRLAVHAPPGRLTSVTVSAGLVLAWGILRLAIFDTTLFPLTFVLPLLVCIWTRDRVAVWAMAALFAALNAVKLLWLLPVMPADAELWANLAATTINVVVGAAVVHLIIVLVNNLEAALRRTQQQAAELEAQGEELAQQNEELIQQSEELSTQNEELHSQAEDIRLLNDNLVRRERLLETLLDVSRLSSGGDATRQMAIGALDLFDVAHAAVIWDATSSSLRVDALATRDAEYSSAAPSEAEDDLVAIVIRERRTAALNDSLLRADVHLYGAGTHAPVRAVLCAPIAVDGRVAGALAIYASTVHDWSDEEFRVAEWLAEQTARLMQVLHVQNDLRRANEEKSAFLATLSHELRNPLTPIRVALALLEETADLASKPVQVLQRQVQHLVRLVDDLLDVTRLARHKIQIRKARIDLTQVVYHAIEASKPDIERAGHVLRASIAPFPVWVDADADRLVQVLTNLLGNAARYTAAGGHIAVTLTRVGETAVLSVADSGMGIDASDRERIFEMFTQLNGPGSGGLGIGLALVRGIVEQHGGRVEVQSDGIGHGSLFRVTLPVTAQADRATPSDSIAPPPRGPDVRRVIVVDDNLDSATMIQALLERQGHVVCTARDGEHALSIVADFRPDVGIVDIGLPGLNGYELAQRLRSNEETSRMRLIALTGWGQQSDRQRAQQAGFDTHLTKPADPATILAAVDRGLPKPDHAPL